MKIYAIVEQMLIEYMPLIKLVLGFMAYSILEYYLGKTDKVKEGSVLEFVWARIKGLFPASRGVDNEPK